MKKILSAIITIMMLLSFASCGIADKVQNNNNQSHNEVSNNLESNNESSQISNISNGTASLDSNISESTNSNTENNGSNLSSPNNSSSKVESSNQSSVTNSSDSSKPQHTHSFAAATCTNPQKCSCGATKGEPLGHKWTNATCTTPKTCSICKVADGDAIGHNWIEATCKSLKTCFLCKETVGNFAGHKWIDATCTTPKTCSVCKKTEGNVKEHNYQNGKCSYCKIDDIIDIDIDFLKNTTYIAYNVVSDSRLDIYILDYECTENGYNIFTTQWLTFSTDYEYCNGANPINYNGITYYGGEGGLNNFCVIIENTLQTFHDWDDWRANNVKSDATYVMQHDKNLRCIFGDVISAGDGHSATIKLFEVYTGNAFWN